MKMWVADFAVRELKWTKSMKESHCQTLVVFSLLFSWWGEGVHLLDAKFFTLQSGQGMSRVVLQSHATLRFIKPLSKNGESIEFTNQIFNFRGFNDKLV